MVGFREDFDVPTEKLEETKDRDTQPYKVRSSKVEGL